MTRKTELEEGLDEIATGLNKPLISLKERNKSIIQGAVAGLVVGSLFCLGTYFSIQHHNKNHLARKALVPYVEMEDGKRGLSSQDIRSFSNRFGINIPHFYLDTITDREQRELTPGDLYFTIQGLSRDSIESLVRSYESK